MGIAFELGEMNRLQRSEVASCSNSSKVEYQMLSRGTRIETELEEIPNALRSS
jgi:hypothetical protein